MQQKHQQFLPLAGLAAAFLTTTGLFAAPLTWVGDVDDNWTTDSGPGDTNWDTDTVPTAGDTAIFENIGVDRTTVVDASFVSPIDQLNINNSTITASERIELATGLTISDNNGIQYGSTISDVGMFELDLNGNTLTLDSQAAPTTYNLFGTYIFDTASSRINSSLRGGTGSDDAPTFNFGDGTNLSSVIVTADGTISHNSNNGTDDARTTTFFSFGEGSTVDISNASTLTLLKSTRVDQGNPTFVVNNSGTFDIASGSSLSVRFDNRKGGDNKRTEFRNLATGIVNQSGDVTGEPDEKGDTNFNNSGTWIINGNAATITGDPNSTGQGDLGNVAFNNQAGGVLRGAGSSDSVSYNPNSDADHINQILTITTQGTISAGAGHNGSGTASVGTLGLSDINIDASTSANTFQFDLANTSNFDIIDLNIGSLDLGSGVSILDVYFVDGFAPTDGNSFEIFANSSITGEFSTINLFNGTGDAADSNNWSFDNSNGVLSFNVIPEPSSTLLILASLGLLIGRRRA